MSRVTLPRTMRETSSKVVDQPAHVGALPLDDGLHLAHFVVAGPKLIQALRLR